MRDLRNVYSPPKRINDSTYSIDVMAGANITDTITEAISVARGLDAAMQFEFNDVTVTVRSDSNPELIYRDWSRALNGYIGKNVGPYPNSVLTNEEEASDARVEAQNDRRRQERQLEAEEAQRRHNLTLEGALKTAPAKMTLRNKKAWKKTVAANTDAYGGGVISFAERWARLMEGRIANGDTLEECAEEAASMADNEGITGFMYGAAVSILAHVWVHGELLRRWHNLKTQIGTEGEKANKAGGVLNPALLGISVREE